VQLLHTDAGPASTDVMFPGQAVTVDMRADKAGAWPMYCQVHDHTEAGMMSTFTIEPAAPPRLGVAGRRLIRAL
jgi:FtsP/CotA-like multicopper oxidase with cupredoxin domain